MYSVCLFILGVRSLSSFLGNVEKVPRNCTWICLCFSCSTSLCKWMSLCVSKKYSLVMQMVEHSTFPEVFFCLFAYYLIWCCIKTLSFDIKIKVLSRFLCLAVINDISHLQNTNSEKAFTLSLFLLFCIHFNCYKLLKHKEKRCFYETHAKEMKYSYDSFKFTLNLNIFLLLLCHYNRLPGEHWWATVKIHRQWNCPETNEAAF